VRVNPEVNALDVSVSAPEVSTITKVLLPATRLVTEVAAVPVILRAWRLTANADRRIEVITVFFI
jgi:hypothetical protein